jgi:tetratricopeptide (TPR) repeat protein
MSLRDNNYNDAAIPHFQKALELDPSLWLARAGEAQCLYNKATKEAYETSVKLDTITVDEIQKILPDASMPKESKDMYLHACLERMGHCLQKLGKHEEELEAYKRAFSYSNRCDTCLCALFRLYHGSKRSEDVLKLFKSLNEPIQGIEYTRLSESLLQEGNYKSKYSYFDSVVIAAFKLNEVPFVVDMYRNAIIVARKQHKPVQATHLELGLAEIYDRYCHDSERAARIWERIVDMYRSTKAETEIAEAKSAAAGSLARNLLKKTIATGKDSSEAERCGIVLERLGKSKTRNQTTINASEATLTLGIWYKLMGRDEEARACFQVQIKEGIRMLSDDDPDNDWDAYWKLVCVLLAAGDDKNLLAMVWKQFDTNKESDSEASDESSAELSEQRIGLTQTEIPVAEKEQDEIRGTSSTDDKNEQPESAADTDLTSMICDGCLRGIAPSHTALCRYCCDVGFCSDCFTLLKSDELPLNICSPKHEWVVIQPRSDEDRAAVQPDKVVVNGKPVSMDEWKKTLAAQWGL